MPRFENLPVSAQFALNNCPWFQSIESQAEERLGGSARLDPKQNMVLQSGEIKCPACPVSVTLEASEVDEEFRLDVFGAADATCP